MIVIYSATGDASQDWWTQAQTREKAEKYYREGIASGNLVRPLYRVVGRIKINQHDRAETVHPIN